MLTMDLDYARMRIGRIRRHLGRMLFGSSLSLLFHILLFVSLVALSWEWFFPPQDNQRQEILMAEIAYGSVAGNPHTTSKTKRQPAAPSKPKKTSSKMDKLAKEDTLKKPTPGFTSAPQQASPKEEVAEISKPIQLATAPQSPIGRGVHSGRLKQPPPQDDSYEELLRLWFAEHQPLQLTLPEQGKR